MVWVWDRSIEWDIKVSEADNKHIWLQGTFLPCVPGGLFSGAGYIVRFNRESGDGRPDIILLDRNTGYAAVFELKLADSPEDMRNAADRAIAQLKECEYGSDLFDYDRIIGFDISFFRKRALARTADMEQYTGNITRQYWFSLCYRSGMNDHRTVLKLWYVYMLKLGREVFSMEISGSIEQDAGIIMIWFIL